MKAGFDGPEMADTGIPRDRTRAQGQDDSPSFSVPMRILVVDDNALNRKVTVQLLNQFGYPAQSATNGFEALDKLERECFELILMDIQMPKMNGLEATRQIRKRQQNVDSPLTQARCPIIIAITAFGISGDEEECLQAGMDGYLEKPIQVERLKHWLNHWQQTIETPMEAPAARKPTDRVPVKADSDLLSIENRVSVDWERFGELSSSQPERLSPLIQSSRTEIQKQLQETLNANRVTEFQKIAHDCAGVCMTFGLVKLATLLRTAERKAKPGSTLSCHKELEHIYAEFNTVSNLLTRWIESHDANNNGTIGHL